MSQFDPGLDIIDAALKGRVLDPPSRPDVEMSDADGAMPQTGEGIYWRLWIKGHETRDFVTASVKGGIEDTIRKNRAAYVPATWTIPPRNLLVRTIHDHLKGGLGRAHEGPREWPVTRVDCRWQPTSQDEWFEAKEWMEKTVNRSLRLIRQHNPDDESRAAEAWFDMDGTVIGLEPELRSGHDTNYNDTMPKLTDIGWHKWRFPGQPEPVPFSFVNGLPFGGLGPPVNPNARQWSVKDPIEPTLNWSFHVKRSIATEDELYALELYIRESFSNWMTSLWNRQWISSTQYNDFSDPKQWGQFLEVKIRRASLWVYDDADEDLRAGDNDNGDEDSHELTYRISCKWNVDQKMMGLPFLEHAFRPVLSGQAVVTQNGIHEYELLCIQMHRIESVRARAEDRPHFYSGWREGYWSRELWPQLSRDQYNQWKCGLIGLGASQTTLKQTADRYNTDEERDRVRVEFYHVMNKETKLLTWRFWVKGALADHDEFGLHMRRAFGEDLRAVTDDEETIRNASISFVFKTTMHYGDPRAKTRGMTRVDCWWVLGQTAAMELLNRGLFGDLSNRSIQHQVTEMSRLFQIQSVRVAEGDRPAWNAAPNESVDRVPPEHDNQTFYDAWECDLSRVHR